MLLAYLVLVRITLDHGTGDTCVATRVSSRPASLGVRINPALGAIHEGAPRNVA